eukprot:328299_1
MIDALSNDTKTYQRDELDTIHINLCHLNAKTQRQQMNDIESVSHTQITINDADGDQKMSEMMPLTSNSFEVDNIEGSIGSQCMSDAEHKMVEMMPLNAKQLPTTTFEV